MRLLPPAIQMQLLPVSSCNAWSAKGGAQRDVRLTESAARLCVNASHGHCICSQALIALLFRPSHDSKLRQTWSVIHRRGPHWEEY